jgi:hypothetical protein
MQKRNEKSQGLRVIEVGDGAFLVESAKGKIFYKCMIVANDRICTCGDFVRHADDESFACKHILAVEACLANGGPEIRGYLKKRQPKLNPDFLITLQGKDFVTYQGLLDLAHQKGLVRIETEIIQYPSKDNGNTAVVTATAESKLGELYSDIGDANYDNCNSKVRMHIIRMASTRAKARVLRDYCNIGMTALEELSDFDEVIGDESKAKTARKNTARKPMAKSNGNDKPQEVAQPVVATEPVVEEQPEPPAANEPAMPRHDNVREIKPKMSEAQKRAIYNLSRRRGISVESLEGTAKEMYGAPVEELNSTDASAFIRHLQQAA